MGGRKMKVGNLTMAVKVDRTEFDKLIKDIDELNERFKDLKVPWYMKPLKRIKIKYELIRIKKEEAER